MTDIETSAEHPESYVDSRGATVDFVSFAEALETVHELASANRIDDIGIAYGDPGLASQRDWQKEALDTLEDFISNHADELDALSPSLKAGEWPQEITASDRGLDPALALNAIKICLAMAEESAIDPSDAREVATAEESDRQQIAFDVTRDLVGLHRAQLEQVETITLPSGFFHS